MKRFTLTVVLAFLSLASPAPVCGQGWETLFPGERLDGWEIQGPSQWVWEDGVLSIQTDAAKENYLIGARDYGDFELQFEFKTAALLYSNVLFRTHPLLQGPTFFGYACEIQPNILPERVGTTLAPGLGNLAKTKSSTMLFSQKERLSRSGDNGVTVNNEKGEWDHLLIRAVGNKLDVELNGVLINSTTDNQYLSGKIAFMIQAGLPNKIEFRNLEIRDLTDEGDYTSIFNGKDFSGWKIHGDEEQWRVEDGIILSESNAKEYSYLATDKEYENFSIIAEFQGLAGGNSGLFFHSHLDGTKISGIQAEVQPPNEDRLGHSGCLYDSSGRGWLIDPETLRPEQEAVFRMDDWNEIRVDVQNHHIVTWINGLQIVDYQDQEPKHDSGVIALQLHSGQLVKVNWRNIRIQELD